jgi:phosphoglycolate phosphatase
VSGTGDYRGVRVLIFDLDGTLIDSKLDLALSVNAARRHLGLAPLEHDTVYGFVGQGAPTLIRRALGADPGGARRAEPSDAEVERGLSHFLSYYREHMLDNTVMYPGVREALDQLAARRHPMAVLTNKPERFSKLILEGLGIAGHFQFVYGGNSFERKKPDPLGVDVLLRDFAAAPREAMMVGDSEIDVLTARNAGIWCCGVTYGLGSHLLAEYPPDLLLDNLADLPARLNGTL